MESEKRCLECLSRRGFLKVGAQTVAIAVATGSASALLAGCGASKDAADASTFSTIPNNSSGVYSFPFTTYSQLQNVGGSIQVNIQATSGTKSVSITRVDANTAKTLSAVCTHASCVVQPYDSSVHTYTCNCHGSVFGSDGSVTTGPARTALTSYVTAISATDIQVTMA